LIVSLELVLGEQFLLADEALDMVPPSVDHIQEIVSEYILGFISMMLFQGVI